jgi:pimeloyl-ACP methyl ester carboxylesterase
VTFIEAPALIAQLPPGEAETFKGLVVIQNQKILDWYRDMVMPARQGADWEFLDRMVKNGRYSFDVAERPFEKPTLIVTGRQDTHAGYQDGWDVLEIYPRATFAVVDRAGHALGVEREGLFRVLVNEWLDRVEESIAAQR